MEEFDLEDLLTQLKLRVEERTKSGFYPPGLDQEMAAHFRRISAQRNSAVREARAALAELVDKMHFDQRSIALESRVPGGGLLHRLSAKLVSRQVQGVLSQVGEYTAALHRVIEILIEAYEETRAEMRGHLEAILERLTEYERNPSDPGIAIGELRRRLEALEALEANQRES